ncbi:hypothetical protein LEN26_010464 [Aphanomyces euteiches]|nr:hypothetical protein AeMF1_017839 [Aphanomyces euteiches]KAH9109797.1 hypothetical protein AeMF1_015206 [Aphanomyces euteiches]KAH9121908.1 hypothetical protein LEN26_010464 [Aphanomyces euteiches]KAH9188662.1 hypothetical protein AeNC1_009367 [Aphanomyces euteiches]
MSNEMSKNGEALIQAVRNGDLMQVRTLLDEGASPNAKGDRGETPLHWAATHEDSSIAAELLLRGADVDQLDSYNRTPLHLASSIRNVNVVKELLKYGAKIDGRDSNGSTPLYVASIQGHLDVAEELLRQGASVDIADNDGDTPLLAASNVGYFSVAKILLDHGASVDLNGKSALLQAHIKQNFQTVNLLLTHGASIPLEDSSDITPLHVASGAGHLETVDKVLAQSVNVDTKDIGSNTALHLASKRGNLDIVEKLLAHGATVDVNGETPLHEASRNGHFDVVKTLLAHDATVDVADSYDMTPLYEASSQGHLDIVKELLSHKAKVDIAASDGKKPLHVASNEGYLDVVKALLDNKTPLHEASSEGHLEVVNELLKYGAMVEVTDSNGETPLLAASSNQNFDIVGVLLANGASSLATDSEGRTSLIYAAYAAMWILSRNCWLEVLLWTRQEKLRIKGGLEHLEVVKVLLAHGATVDIGLADGKTPLMAASNVGHLDIVKVLLAHGANIAATSSDGMTPLLEASNEGHFDVVRELLKQGAMVDAADTGDETALHKAAENGHIEIVEVLLEAGADIHLQNKNGKTAHDLGSADVKHLIAQHQQNEMPKSISSAVEIILQAIDMIDGETSDLVVTAYKILSHSMNLHIQRERVLATSLLIERIVRHVMSKGPPSEAPDLVPNLKDIETYWETTLIKNSNHFDYKIASFKSQKTFMYILKFKWWMATMAKCLESIAGIADLQQQQDSLLELAIQFQRSLEHYEREVALGNIPRINDFQEQVEFCKDQIGVTAQVLSETREMPKSFSLEVIQTWMLSSDDVSFEPENERSILGQGGFGSVYKGKYFGKEVAIKRFDQVNVTDSADLEKLIAREVKAWKDISNERYILTLIGVCTKFAQKSPNQLSCVSCVKRTFADMSATGQKPLFPWYISLPVVYLLCTTPI